MSFSSKKSEKKDQQVRKKNDISLQIFNASYSTRSLVFQRTYKKNQGSNMVEGHEQIW